MVDGWVMVVDGCEVDLRPVFFLSSLAVLEVYQFYGSRGRKHTDLRREECFFRIIGCENLPPVLRSGFH